MMTQEEEAILKLVGFTSVDVLAYIQDVLNEHAEQISVGDAVGRKMTLAAAALVVGEQLIREMPSSEAGIRGVAKKVLGNIRFIPIQRE